MIALNRSPLGFPSECGPGFIRSHSDTRFPPLPQPYWWHRQIFAGCSAWIAKRPVTRLLAVTAVEEAAHADFVADAVNLGQRHAVVGGRLLEGHLPHQLIDVYEAGFLASHARGNGSKIRSGDGTLSRPAMPTNPAKRRLTARDTEILLALDRCPLTVGNC